MRKILAVALMVIIVDAFYFDVAFRFLPSVNTKMMLAVVGIFAFVFKSIREGKPQISRRVFISAILAVTFSLWCYLSIVINGSYERTFVTYFVSFATWLGGAYGVYSLLKARYERIDLMLITYYLALVCVSQCGIALLIDNLPFFRSFVNTTFAQASDMYEQGGRLYGIGCALDPAGVRFSAVQVLIAHQLAKEERVRRDVKKSTFLFVSFLVITIIGSMISRTTIVGTALGLAYIVFTNFEIHRGGFVSKLQVNSTLLMLGTIGAAVFVSVYLYNSNPNFHENLRFGFEGFFNWIETGEFRTGSTDHLRTMWVWPTTRRGWIIGEGRVGVFQTNSDIGYCNYIIYCGLIGFTIYSAYYIFNHLSLTGKFRNFTLTALLLVAVTFIVWSKVTTDIFLVDALLFCMDDDIPLPAADDAPEEVEASGQV